MRRKELTLRHTKNGKPGLVPMTPEVYHSLELWQARRLDTHRVFLYKGPLQLVTAYKAACRRAGITNFGYMTSGIRQART